MTYTPRHRAEPKVVYRVHYRESERGWGQDFWHVDFGTMDEAQAAYDECNDALPKGYVPDYYIQADRIETVTL